jgi:hypothetical protein
MSELTARQAMIERGLKEWAERRTEWDASRDEIVRGAVAAGISKHRVHVLTGIARTTIDRIVGQASE